MIYEEKLAEEYRKSLWQRLTDEDNFERLEMFDENVEEAFLAGLEAGRPKWHKVADGDLPNTDREVLVFMWDSYYLGYYKPHNGEDSSWHFNDFDEKSEEVIAWCEIPQYT